MEREIRVTISGSIPLSDYQALQEIADSLNNNEKGNLSEAHRRVIRVGLDVYPIPAPHPAESVAQTQEA